ncbi:MFS transporter [Klebsiella variicola subsp. variicola]|nr:MFS transporter [Klebsiella variicola subsp. variicola]
MASAPRRLACCTRSTLFIALLMQPFFGFISDKFGLKKRLIWLLVALLLPVGPFFIYVYAPLLVHNFWFGALLGDLSGDHL